MRPIRKVFVSDLGNGRYRVERLRNTTAPSLGEILTKREVDALCHQGWQIDIKSATKFIEWPVRKAS